MCLHKLSKNSKGKSKKSKPLYQLFFKICDIKSKNHENMVPEGETDEKNKNSYPNLIIKLKKVYL